MNKEKSNYRWFVLSIGVLAQATFAMGFAGIPVTGVIMRESYHFTLFELGVVLGAMGIGVAVSEIIWGILTDKLGDKAVLIVGLWASAATFIVIAFMITPEAKDNIDYVIFSLALLAAGAFGGSINSSSGRTVMSWFDAHERGFAMSIRQTAIPVGGAIGTAILPWLAVSYGFKTAFIVLACVGFFIGFVVLLFINSKHERAMMANAPKSTEPSPLKSLDVWKVTLAAGFLTVPQMSVLTFGGLYLKDALQVNLALISILLIGVQIAGGALRICSGYYTDRQGTRIPLLKQISIFGGIAGLVLSVFAGWTVVGILFLVLTGLIGHAWHGIAYTEAAIKAGVSRAGTALGMIGTTVFLSAFLTPILMSRMVEWFGWAAAWGAVGVLTLLAYLFFLEPQKQGVVVEGVSKS